MECKRCHRSSFEELLWDQVCPACIADDRALYYSTGHLRHVEKRLTAALEHWRSAQQRWPGDDRLSNPTKGRARLNEARSAVENLRLARAGIRAVLIDRGDIEPTVEESLDRAFPNSKNKEVVEWEGKRFRCKWIHEGMDRRGRNMWRREWTALDGEQTG
jgi:hypothetical protein